MDNTSVRANSDEYLRMFAETSDLLRKESSTDLSNIAIAYHESTSLSGDVEFWNWMGRNYNGIFNSSESMQQYAAAQEQYLKNSMLKGKGYEWDAMQAKRLNPANIRNQYYLGDDPVRPGTDLTETDLFTGSYKEYQMKAYTSSNTPNVSHTPEGTIVETNAEHVDAIKKKGYKVESFKDNKEITKDVDKRYGDMKSGKASPTYTIKNVGGMVAKAGAIGFVIGIGAEAFVNYKAWKNHELSDKEYLSSILKAGGESGITSAGTAGLMLPISAKITAAGISGLVNIPAAIVFSAGINKVVAPAFGRGDYRKILNECKYYQSLDLAYKELAVQMEEAGNQYTKFIGQIQRQNTEFQIHKKESERINDSLKSLYDSI